MKLLTKLLVATVVTVVLITAVSEWLSHQTTMRFLEHHVAEMAGHDSPQPIARTFEESARNLGRELAAIHVIHALLAVAAIIVVLCVFWNWLVVRPIQEILEQMNRLSRSVSYKHIEPRCMDEVGQMAVALNHLGDRLTESLGDAMTASELSALALVGQSIVRKVSVAHDQLVNAETLLAAAGRRGIPPPPSTISAVRAVADRLHSIPEQFEFEFEKRLNEKRTQAMGDRQSATSDTHAVIRILASDSRTNP